MNTTIFHLWTLTFWEGSKLNKNYRMLSGDTGGINAVQSKQEGKEMKSSLQSWPQDANIFCVWEAFVK